MDSMQKWFDELYTKNYKRMISIAMRLGFSLEEAEELVQDSFRFTRGDFGNSRARKAARAAAPGAAGA